MRLKDVEVTNLATYQPPFLSGIIQGRFVTITACGNAEGHSPVLQFVDQEGVIGWAEESDFTIALPGSLEAAHKKLKLAA